MCVRCAEGVLPEPWLGSRVCGATAPPCSLQLTTPSVGVSLLLRGPGACVVKRSSCTTVYCKLGHAIGVSAGLGRRWWHGLSVWLCPRRGCDSHPITRQRVRRTLNFGAHRSDHARLIITAPVLASYGSRFPGYVWWTASNRLCVGAACIPCIRIFHVAERPLTLRAFDSPTGAQEIFRLHVKGRQAPHQRFWEGSNVLAGASLYNGPLFRSVTVRRSEHRASKEQRGERLRADCRRCAPSCCA